MPAQIGWSVQQKLEWEISRLKYKMGGSSVIPINKRTFHFIFTGESNSGGYAVNADLSPTEAGVRSSVQILNNTTLGFQSLQIGVNNLIGHAGLPDNATHGWENGLANIVDAGTLKTPVYLTKTGQGGSLLSQWNVGGAYFNTLTDRYNASIANLAALGITSYTNVIFYSHGINDAIAGTPVNTWKAEVIAHLANLRTLIGADTIVIMTRLMEGPYNTYNLAIDDIIANDPYTFCVPTQDLPLRDTNHWSYLGMKSMASRMVNYLTTVNTNYNNAILIFDGSSLTNSGSLNGYGNGPKYPEVVQLFKPFAKNGSTFYNFGINGQDTEDMIADAPSQIDPLYNILKKCVVIPWEIGNDIYYNGNAQNAYDNYVTYCLARKAVGFKVLAVTSTSRDMAGTTVFGDTYAQWRVKNEAANNLVRANWQTFADGLCDLAADSRLLDATNTDYYIDGVHHNGAGRVVVAELVKQQLLNI